MPQPLKTLRNNLKNGVSHTEGAGLSHTEEAV